MKYGSDQTHTRDNNLEMVIKLLQKDNLSSSDLASKMHLSKTALGKIITEMIDNNLVRCVDIEDIKNTKGRKKTYYELNKDAGLVCVINFAGNHVEVVISNLSYDILKTVVIENREFIDMSTIEEIVSIINGFKKRYANESRSILSISIAAAGKINRETQAFKQSPKFVAIKDLNLKDYFETKFETTVFVKNDINLMLLGEVEKDREQKDLQDVLLLHIDTGIGGAIFNKGSIIEGEQGYAGEFGLMKTFDRMGQMAYYDTLCSTRSLKNQIKYYKSVGEKTEIDDNVTFNEVVRLYQKNDKLVCDIVNQSAKYISMMVSNLYNIFDFTHIFISGEIKLLGKSYLDEVVSNLGQEKNDVILSYSNYGDEAITYGALNVSISQAFKTLVNNRRNTNSTK